MMDDDEELCPVCESTCTCNHQPKDRGSARANGYKPKKATSTSGGKNHQYYAPNITHSSPSPSTSALPQTASPSAPLKIRLVLGQRKPSTTNTSATTTSTPTPSFPSSSQGVRRKRSITYTSSSDASSSSSRGDARARPPSPSTSAHRRRPSPTSSSHRLASTTPKPSHQERAGKPPKHASSGSRDTYNSTHDTSRAPVRLPSSLASSSRNSSAHGPLASSSTSTSKPKAGPSSAWFLGAPPPKSNPKAGASRKPAGFKKERSPISTAVAPVIARPLKASSGPKRPTHSTKSQTVPKLKDTAKPHKKPTTTGAGGTRRTGSSPKKRRRIDYSPSPSPPPDISSASEDDDFNEADFVPRPPASFAQRGRGRGRGGIATGGVTLGRPVGVVIPTFVPKTFSSPSSSSQDDDSDDDSSDQDAGLDDPDLDDPDEDIQMEEERMILKEERKKDRTKKKRDGGGGGGGEGRHKKNHADADIFMGSDLTSLSSSSSAEQSEASSASTDEEDAGEDDDDDEDEVEPDDMEIHPVGGWTESEDETDADLFFANFLSDGDEEDAKSSGPEDVAHPAKAEDEDGNPMGEFDLNGDIFVDADSFGLVKRRKLLRHPHSHHHHRGRGRHHRGGSTRKSEDPGFEQPLIITEDSDGHLVFADGWGAGEGMVNTEWEKTQLAVMMNDEDVTSEESDVPMGEAVKETLEEADTSSEETETDFDGETTVDEGLDEDGLPPTMAAQSQQHRSEREFNRRRLHAEQLAMPLPDHLPPGIELFQGGYATVLYGRSEFPKIDFPSLQPHPMTDPASEYNDVWQGIRDDEPEDDSEGVTQAAPAEDVKPVAPLSPTDILSNVHALRSESLDLDLEGGLRISTGVDPMMLAGAFQPSEAPHPSTSDEEHLEPETQSDNPPPSPPRKMPAMGCFKPSPPPPPSTSSSRPKSASADTAPTPALQTESRAVILSPGDAPPSNGMLPPPSFERPAKGVAIIDGKTSMTIPSPFANVKRRKKRPATFADESDGSMSVGQPSDSYFSQPFGPWAVPSRTRKPSVSSNRSSFSQAFPPLGFRSFGDAPALATPIKGVFDQQPQGLMFAPPNPIDLMDVLESSVLDEDAAAMVGTTTGDEDDILDPSTLRNLTRWQRVPMGTFRHSRALGSSAGNDAELQRQIGESPRRISDGFSYGAVSRPSVAMPSAALWSNGTDVKGKGKEKAVPETPKRRRRKVIISPVLLPTTEEPALAAEPEELDVDLMTGVEEEEGYFSKKHHKGGREGTERERVKRKFEEKERRHGTLRSPLPLHKRIKSGTANPLLEEGANEGEAPPVVVEEVKA